MTQELKGLENEIENMKCNMEKPFAFISYSHDDYDSKIVINVFKKLMNRGYNLWIDTADMLTNENSWKKLVRGALRNENCKMAFFFRSESSMVKDTTAYELDLITDIENIKLIAAVDIWHEVGMSAEKFRKKILNDKSTPEEDMEHCTKICD